MTSNLPEEQHDFVAPLKFVLTRAAWDAVIPVIMGRVRALEGTIADYHAVIALLETQALTVISDTITAEINVRRAELDALSADAAAVADQIALIQAGGIDAASVSLAEIANLAASNAQDAFAELMAGVQANAASIADLKPIEFIGLTEATNLVAGKPYRLLAHSISHTLPETPSIGASIQIIDGGVLSAASTVTLARNSKTIMGLGEDLVLDQPGLSFIIWWDGSTWRLF